MSDTVPIPDPTVDRLALYHCLLGEMVREGTADRVTSGRLAEVLDFTEETVRRDLTFVSSMGRPGSGYDVRDLVAAIQKTLGIEDEYPVVRIGSAEMLRALQVVFPASAYGVRPVAYFSELPEDVGAIIDGIPVKHITALAELDPELGVSVALIACSPTWVQVVVDQCAKAGLTGLLILTPYLSISKPEGVTITQVRMPCDIKSLACRCRVHAPVSE